MYPKFLLILLSGEIKNNRRGWFIWNS